MSTAFDTCALCPRLCRVSCPVATLTGREAAVPSMIAEVLRAWKQGRVSDALAREAATLCVDCGRCQVRCHLDQPLPAALREAWVELTSVPAPRALQPIVGAAAVVAVLTDGRDWSEALTVRSRSPVARWHTDDALGERSVGGPGWEAHLEAVRAQAAGRELVVTHGGVAGVLRAAGVSFRWLHELWDLPAVRCGCTGEGELAPVCCGGAGPLAAHHPEDAARMAARWKAQAPDAVVGDARCAAHLRSAGIPVAELIDQVMRRG